MLGAILGDIIGSPYEFDHQNIKTKEFPLFSADSGYTDDTVMTLAVAEGLMNGWRAEPEEMKKEIVKAMQRLGRRYPNAGYGGMFYHWLLAEKPAPYNSFGNGSAMRVSSVAWLYDDLAAVLQQAALTAEVTHNHPEGIKGAQATAAAIFLSRTGADKRQIKAYIAEQFGYDMNRSVAEIRPHYRHVESCQESVPEAIIAFLEGNDFEDVIRTAVSLGGDSDTIAAIAGSIAEAYYGIPEKLQQKVPAFLDADLNAILDRYKAFLENGRNNLVE